MNYLEKLLQGAKAEWKPLGEIATLYGGLTGKNKSDFENGNSRYITYKNIFNNLEVNMRELEYVNVFSDERQHKIKYGDVLFTGSSETAVEAGMSSVVTTKINEDIYLNSFSFGLRFNDDIDLLPEFTKYLFRSNMVRQQITKTASGVTRFNVSKERFKKIKIPIPPLTVQQQIVEILDKMTALTNELTQELDKELTLRQKQYQYYRDKLLNFKDISGGGNRLFGSFNVEWNTLGEVGKFIRGSSLQKKDFTEKGIGCIHYGQIYTYYGMFAYQTKTFVSKEFAKNARKAKKGNLVIATTSENDEDVCKAVAWLGEEEIVVSNDACFFDHKLNPKYVAYFFQTENFQKQKKGFVTGTKVKRVNVSSLEKIKIPIPPLSIQQKIVAILDKFDTLTQSISEGLPKEIELRKKQYAYYRDQLLNFEQA